VKHLEPLGDSVLNRLLGMVVDVENIFMSMNKELDSDTKRVYFYLFKVCTKISIILAISDNILSAFEEKYTDKPKANN
jgi:PCAF (P300/CBP-associated factor) N-terminal domain